MMIRLLNMIVDKNCVRIAAIEQVDKHTYRILVVFKGKGWREAVSPTISTLEEAKEILTQFFKDLNSDT